MWNKVITGILILLTAGVIAAVFTVPSLGWLTKTEGALVHWAAYILIFLAVVVSINLHIRPEERSYV